MKKVKLLVNTAYQGPRKEGDVITVPDDFAARWTKNKIAEYVDEEEVKEEGPVLENPEEEETGAGDNNDAEDSVEETKEEVDYESMSAKELYALCKERGIEAEAKKSKEYYIEKLA